LIILSTINTTRSRWSWRVAGEIGIIIAVSLVIIVAGTASRPAPATGETILPEVHDVTTYKQILCEDFNQYVDGDVPTTGWTISGTSANAYFKALSHQGHFYDNDDGATLNAKYTFSAAQSSAGAGSVSMQLNLVSLPVTSRAQFVLKSAAGYRVRFYVETDGKVTLYSNLEFTYSGATLSIGTNYTFIITFTDTTHWTLSINGTVYGPYVTFNSLNDVILDLLLTGNDNTCDFYIDDIYMNIPGAGGLQQYQFKIGRASWRERV
jgi:hypothetical protein